MGRTTLRVRFHIGNEKFYPAKLQIKEDGDFFIYARFPILGLHYSNHNREREHIRTHKGMREWILGRKLTEIERHQLQELFSYRPRGNHTLYVLPSKVVFSLGRQVASLTHQPPTLDVSLNKILDKFPFEEVHGVASSDLAHFLRQQPKGSLLGLDYEQMKLLVAWRVDDADSKLLGLPLEPEVMAEMLQDTPLDDGLFRPLWNSAKFAIKYLDGQGRTLQEVEANLETFTEIIVPLSEEFHSRLVEHVGTTNSPTED